MLAVVTSANVACGLHAGDPEIMASTFRLAKEKGVAVGAHPGFPDLWGFGRRRMPFTPAEIERLVRIRSARRRARRLCRPPHHLREAHGALANLAAEDRAVADAIAGAVRAVDRNLALLAIALTAQVPAGEAAGLDVHQEIFADRGYTEDGQLISRSQPGALITDRDEAASRVLTMVQEARSSPLRGAPADADPLDLRPRRFGPRGRHRPRGAGELEGAGVTLAPFKP